MWALGLIVFHTLGFFPSVDNTWWWWCVVRVLCWAGCMCARQPWVDIHWLVAGPGTAPCAPLIIRQLPRHLVEWGVIDSDNSEDSSDNHNNSDYKDGEYVDNQVVVPSVICYTPRPPPPPIMPAPRLVCENMGSYTIQLTRLHQVQPSVIMGSASTVWIYYVTDDSYRETLGKGHTTENIVWNMTHA